MDEQDSSSLTYFVQQLLTKPLYTFIRGNEVIYQTNVQLFRIHQRANDPLQAPNFSPWFENLLRETNTSVDSTLLDSTTRARQSRYNAGQASFDYLKGEKPNIKVPYSHVRNRPLCVRRRFKVILRTVRQSVKWFISVWEIQDQ